MRRAVLRHACLLIALFFAMAPAEAAKRVALVIGINSYPNLPAERQLKKAVNDARSIRDTLKADLGFDVLYEENTDWGKMNGLIKQAEARIDAGDVVFIYFSGHGVSIGAENYLLPSDIPRPMQGEEARLIGNSFGAEALAQRLRKRGARAVFSVLDACRDNPFVDEKGKAVGLAGGLTTIDRAQGVFTLFAAGLGQVALDRVAEDDPNPNSVFTRSLIPLLKTGGLTQVDLAKKVQQEVVDTAAAIGHDQMPVYNDGLLGFVTLKEREEAPAAPKRISAAEEEWRAIEKSDSKEALEAFQRKYRDEPLYVGLAANRLAALSDEKGNISTPDAGATTTPQTQIVSIDPAVEELVRQCDMLASDPSDPDKSGGIPGISFKDIVSNDAAGICEKAIGIRPDLRRLVYQTGRAFDHAANYKTANTYYDKAAAMGSKAAMAQLSYNYREGLGVKKDSRQAIEWGKKALRTPNSWRERSDLSFDIGYSYSEGDENLQPDPKLARAWFAVSLEEGGKNAALNLASLIMDGKGGSRRPDIAASLLLLSYCRGAAMARDFLLKDENLTKGGPQDFGFPLQEILKQKGFYLGEIDGVIGAATRTALEQAEATICPEIEEKLKAEGGVFASLREQGVVGEDPRKELQ